MNYSIIIVTYNRLDLLQKCIAEITSQSPKAKVLVGINGHDDASQAYLQNCPNVTFKSFKKVTPGEVRNDLAKMVETPWICFLDDDVIVSDGYFKKVENILSTYSNLDIFGGPDASYPGEDSTETAISLALTSPIATAHSRKRHTVSKTDTQDATEQDLILCNLWMRTSLFQKENFSFDKRFFRNEENVLLHLLLKANKKAMYFGELFVHHKRKNNLFQMIITVMKSANFRAKSFMLFPDSFNFLYTVPSLFFLYIVTIPFYECFLKLIPLFIYFLVLIYFTWKVCSSANKMNLFFQVMLVQILINLSYGVGFISPPRSTKTY
ncbi:hypothetical protein A9Q84_19815 [Halobacteriovorax marinus]|uniref:Glycosyltransferase 2-like domain-containing protein n=1 Tax=Halobacteriovorax marinus TaxID=97084 RepID=A0A1Y5F2Q1_9BACT|nr:hypothetical protein A9Q84_19815 [Halobacteriovorax marinus]